MEEEGRASYCLRGDRERERERVLERLRLLLLLFLPIFTSFLKLERKRSGESERERAQERASERDAHPLCGLFETWFRVSGSFLAAFTCCGLGDFSSAFTTLGEQGLDAGEKPPSVVSAGVPSGFRPLAFSLASARNTFLFSTSFSSCS